MMKKKYLLVLLVLFMAFTLKVNASTCSSERIVELSTLASNVNVSYERYDNESETDGDVDDTFGVEVESFDPAFYITIYNLPNDLNAMVVREDTKKAVVVYNEDSSEDGVIRVDAGNAYNLKSFTVKIRSNDSNCQNEILASRVVNTPKYNSFYERQICEENPEVEMCQEFTMVDYSNMSDREFESKVETYKEEKKKEEERKNSVWFKISQFLDKYKWIIIGIVAGIVIVIITYIVRRKKSRLI